MAFRDVVRLPIDHIDPGGTAFTDWKNTSAGRWMQRYNEVLQEYKSGLRPLYWKDQP